MYRLPVEVSGDSGEFICGNPVGIARFLIKL